MSLVLAPTRSGSNLVLAPTQAVSGGGGPTVTGVSVSPSVSTGSTTFSAIVNGTGSPSQAVTWACNLGSINSSGVFTAPAQTSSQQVITITATSVQDPTQKGFATVTIPSNVAVTGAPDYASYSKPKTYAVKRGDQTFVYTSKERAMAAFKAQLLAEQAQEQVDSRPKKKVAPPVQKIAPGDWDSMLKMLDGMNGNYDMNKINRFL